MIRFGPAGASDSFYEERRKSSLDMPEWLKLRGLNAFEYQCGRGVHIGEETAMRLGRQAKEHGIQLSLHAPYYINLSSTDPTLQVKTRGHLIKSLRVAQAMGAKTVVFHPGAGSGGDRKDALARASRFFKEILAEVEGQGLAGIVLAPETMGKQNQLGSLEEVLELCELGEQVRPCLDFGHLHAVSGGGLADQAAFAVLLDQIESRLGAFYLQDLHIHFSPIEYTAAGEKKHRTGLEPGFGPDFALLAELLIERGMTPTVICESAGRQAEDAATYRDIYLDLLKKRNSMK
ncbi:MAG: putative endonuclease 4 [Pelotomaculum sp. PtaB.Bin104]|nr:MAG: putative endonuclease 4 [Pelotomaculum sp. PtaB.Bin104]